MNKRLRILAVEVVIILVIWLFVRNLESLVPLALLMFGTVLLIFVNGIVFLLGLRIKKPGEGK
jgi:hypothetical protein